MFQNNGFRVMADYEIPNSFMILISDNCGYWCWYKELLKMYNLASANAWHILFSFLVFDIKVFV